MTNPKIGTLCDNFDQGSINSNLWTNPSGWSLATLSSQTISTDLTMKTVGGEVSVPLSVTIPVVSCVSNSSGIQSVNSYDLTDSGLSVELTSYTSGNTFFKLISGTDFLEWYAAGAGGANAFASSGLSAPVGVTASLPLYVRIRESSGVVYWDYSSDGDTWTNATSASDPFDLTSVSVLINGGTASWANIDYVL